MKVAAEDEQQLNGGDQNMQDESGSSQQGEQELAQQPVMADPHVMADPPAMVDHPVMPDPPAMPSPPQI